jgi:hypothetical protein
MIADFCENGDESLGLMKAGNFSTTFSRKTLYHSVNYEKLIKQDMRESRNNLFPCTAQSFS